jgi:aldehyde dehydrogenase (NAD+)
VAQRPNVNNESTEETEMTQVVETEPSTTAYQFDSILIDGEWRSGRASSVNTDTDPWSGEELASIVEADVEDVDDMYRSAETIQKEWEAALPGQRATVLRSAGGILERRHDEVVDWLVREAGSTRTKAELEWAIVRDGLYEAASMPHDAGGHIVPSDIPAKENLVFRQPAGVVTVISPWNFPMWLSARSVAPALALGNSVVLKPATDTPVTGGLLLGRIFEEAGLPSGVLSVIVGSGRTIGDALVQHRTPRVISFTGSTAVGGRLPMIAGIKRLSLELGGNGPMVILDDANLGNAVEAAVFGSFFHQGQICMIANRLVVDVAVYDEFVDRLVERTRKLVVGDPKDPATYVGPIISKHQLKGILDKLERARGAGAKELLGGAPTGPTGQTLPPHVLLGTNDMATAKEEVFGPVITVVKASGEEDALRIANDTEYGLSSAVFTGDIDRGVRFAHRVKAGMTHVNDSPLNDEPNVAFGGEKSSGLGRFGGQWAVEEFTTHHWISVQHEPRQYP